MKRRRLRAFALEWARGSAMVGLAMTTTHNVIENPVINLPFAEPERHFRFSEEGIANEMVEACRESAYFIPIAAARKEGKSQLYFETECNVARLLLQGPPRRTFQSN
jgi:hypothetical protein